MEEEEDNKEWDQGEWGPASRRSGGANFIGWEKEGGKNLPPNTRVQKKNGNQDNQGIVWGIRSLGGKVVRTVQGVVNKRRVTSEEKMGGALVEKIKKTAC